MIESDIVLVLKAARAGKLDLKEIRKHTGLSIAEIMAAIDAIGWGRARDMFAFYIENGSIPHQRATEIGDLILAVNHALEWENDKKEACK